MRSRRSAHNVRVYHNLQELYSKTMKRGLELIKILTEKKLDPLDYIRKRLRITTVSDKAYLRALVTYHIKKKGVDEVKFRKLYATWVTPIIVWLDEKQMELQEKEKEGKVCFFFLPCFFCHVFFFQFYQISVGDQSERWAGKKKKEETKKEEKEKTRKKKKGKGKSKREKAIC